LKLLFFPPPQAGKKNTSNKFGTQPVFMPYENLKSDFGCVNSVKCILKNILEGIFMNFKKMLILILCGASLWTQLFSVQATQFSDKLNNAIQTELDKDNERYMDCYNELTKIQKMCKAVKCDDDDRYLLDQLMHYCVICCNSEENLCINLLVAALDLSDNEANELIRDIRHEKATAQKNRYSASNVYTPKNILNLFCGRQVRYPKSKNEAVNKYLNSSIVD
jgi:hypothetical protein